MNKKIRLELSEYNPLPPSLCDAVKSEFPCADIFVDLASLYHHYYLDTYGVEPPSPDPAHFEHVRFLMPDTSFRFQGNGLGASTSARRSRSTELGQAFCRWFLHEHLGMTYFAHIGELMDRQEVRGIAGCKIERTASGDTPDYFCAQNVSAVYLAEAKGRYTSISFKSKEFNEWRDQFQRIRVLNSSGVPQSVKGHIVATRFATEEDSERIQSKIFAEDPQTEGDTPLNEASAQSLAATVIGIHYSHFMEKLNQPLLAAVLWSGVPLPREILVPFIIWKLDIDLVESRLFVGGYYPGATGKSALNFIKNKIDLVWDDPFRLDQSRGTFVGIEYDVFRSIVKSCRSTGVLGPQLLSLELGERIYSAVSLHRDGSVVGPIELFTPVRQETL